MPDPVPPDNSDLTLHQEISPRERLDAILDAPHLTTEQAVRAMDGLYAEGQATYPHLIKFVVPSSPSLTTGLDDHPDYVAYYGPFENRRAAEHWATGEWPESDQYSWMAEKIETPQMHKEAKERMNRAIEDDPS